MPMQVGIPYLVIVGPDGKVRQHIQIISRQSLLKQGEALGVTYCCLLLPLMHPCITKLGSI